MTNSLTEELSAKSERDLEKECNAEERARVRLALHAALDKFLDDALARQGLDWEDGGGGKLVVEVGVQYHEVLSASVEVSFCQGVV